MRRDWKLIHAILSQLEQDEDYERAKEPEIAGYTRAQVLYHVQLLPEAGLITSSEVAGERGGTEWRAISLTFRGHDFLETAKDENR